jgi:hypothetical protein
MAESKRQLSPLPGHGAVVEAFCDWLTKAVAPPPGWRVHAFVRAGRQRKDPATLILAKGGQLRHFRFAEQRDLSVPGSMRASVYAACDGFCRMPALGKPELEDVWAALCSLAQVLADQDDRDEAREWVEGCMAIAQSVNGITFEPSGRYDALQFLRRRPVFTRRAAFELGDPSVPPDKIVRPALVIDNAGPYWLRALELATYVRHVVGVHTSQSTLDARVAEVGVGREHFEVRRGKEHPELVLYRLSEHYRESSK